MRPLLAAVTSLMLAACANWPSGGDPKGLELKAEATPVLAALVAYRRDRGEYPQSLQELVPRYLKAVPFAPGLRYDRESGNVEFHYEPSWPQPGKVLCFAKAGATEWTCDSYV